MNKKDLVLKTSELADSTKLETARIVDAVLEVITDALTAGDTIQLLGFGTFTVGHRAERTGIHPGTKQPMLIPAKNVVKFKAGKKTQDAVNPSNQVQETVE